ncbi:MAG: NAD(P)H-quinone oxidoreductase [Halioglobus sp.]|nr:NAD(P)H-quinone oxidoreductase [Halioglobus sp.]
MTEIPSQCRHVAVDPETHALSLEPGPVPTPGATEVLVRVHAAGINRADLLQRKGLYPPPEDASPILGLEVSGEVVAAGEKAGHWRPGDAVCALTHGGGYAEYAVAPAGQCMPVPRGFSHAEAAALPEALLTIWHNVFQRARLEPGERILMHGGASGVGTLGIALCYTLGAEVYTTAGTAEKCAALEARGATRAINYREEDFEQVLADIGVGGGVDVVLDMVGGSYIQKNLDVAAPEGRIVNIAFMQGFSAEVNFAPLLMKRLTLTGSTLRAQTFEQKDVMVKEIMDRVFPLLERDAFRPVIDSTFSLDEVEKAHERMLSGEHMGKIILQTGMDT